MLSVEDALDLIREAAGEPRRQTECVPVAEALGRVLAEDVAMDHDVPPFRRASMDGFALRVADLRAGLTLAVVAEVAAGALPDVPVGPGQAVRIMTGAPVPDGADFVVPFEWTSSDRSSVTINEVGRGPNLVERGAHTAAGDVVVPASTPLRAGALGALASAGVSQVTVAARPRIAIVGTGSELVPVDAAPGPARIRNSNSTALAGQTLRAGAVPIDLGIAKDDEATLRARIREGLEADVLLLSGGVSKGDLDLVPAALAAEGVREVFHRWNVQPGGPLWFGVKGATLVYGLPGNPAATFVGFEIAVLPALGTRLGLPFAPRRTLSAHYEGAWGRPSPRRRYRPVTLDTEADGRLIATALAWRGSGDPFSVAFADGLAVLPEGEDAPAPGLVDVVPVAGSALVWGPA